MENELLTLDEVIEILKDAVAEEGTQDNFAAKHYFSTTLISFTLTGKKHPGPSILNALGLEKVTLYRMIE